MVLDFLKKKKDAPPDVGKEDEYEASKKKLKIEEPGAEEETGEAEIAEEPEEKPRKISAPDEFKSLELEKIKARLEALDSILRGYSERFSSLSEKIGEIRSMALENEKEISKVEVDTGKAVDIVKEVQPEKLRVDYQRIDMRIAAIEEKIEANKQFMEAIMNEVKDLRQKAGIFIGTDALLKLNEEVKNDLIETQKLANRVRVNTDKSEEIFVELRRGFAEKDKMNQVIANLDTNYSGLKTEFEKMKVDMKNSIKQDEFSDLKKMITNRFAAIEKSLVEVGNIKEENEKLSQLIEAILSIEKKNKDDIADIAITIGDDRIKRVSEYDEKLSSILRIIDELAGQITMVKKIMNISKEKISVNHVERKIMTKNKVRMRHINIHPKISKSLTKKPGVSKVIEKIKNKSKKDEKYISNSILSVLKKS